MERIDSKARNMLAYLNTCDLSGTVLARAFNDHYKNDLQSSFHTLQYLQSRSLVTIKSDKSGEKAIIITVTHQGKTYEQSLVEEENEKKKELWKKRRWELLIVGISAIVSVITAVVTTIITNQLI